MRIVGIGSPFGDDRIGWHVIAMLERYARITRLPRERIDMAALDRPGMSLVAWLEGAERVFLIDALRSGAPPGSVRRLAPAALAQHSSALSSHGHGVAAALALAQALGATPGALVVYGIEIEDAQPRARPSTAAARAARAVARSILRELPAPAQP